MLLKVRMTGLLQLEGSQVIFGFLLVFVFIFSHVFHLHGWLHFDWFLDGVAKPLGGAQFSPYNASSTLAAAFQKNWLIPVAYTVGVASCIFHLSNGIWSFGVRWGIWTSPTAMRRAGLACAGFGILLGAVSLGAVAGPMRTDPTEAREIEQEMYDARLASHDVEPNPHKRAPEAGQPANRHETAGRNSD